MNKGKGSPNSYVYISLQCNEQNNRRLKTKRESVVLSSQVRMQVREGARCQSYKEYIISSYSTTPLSDTKYVGC